MTHQAHPSVTRGVVQVLAEHGFDGMAQAMELLFKRMHEDRAATIASRGPLPAGQARRGQANGFKPKRHKTRIGPLELATTTIIYRLTFVTHVEPSLGTKRVSTGIVPKTLDCRSIQGTENGSTPHFEKTYDFPALHLCVRKGVVI